MGIRQIGFDVSSLAAADYSTTGQYLLVYRSSGTQVTKVATAGVRCDGVLMNAPASGADAQVATMGLAPVVYGGTVTAGDLLTADASGQAVKSTGKGDFIVGRAVISGVVSDIGTIDLTREGVLPVIALTFQIALASITAAGDVVTTLTPGFKGEIMDLDYTTNVPATTGSKLASLNAEIGTTDVTGGVLALTSANCTPMGKVVTPTAITAANAFTATDTISIEAASVTAFAEGDGTLTVWLRATG